VLDSIPMNPIISDRKENITLKAKKMDYGSYLMEITN